LPADAARDNLAGDLVAEYAWRDKPVVSKAEDLHVRAADRRTAHADEYVVRARLG
jgi:hypothetical protein